MHACGVGRTTEPDAIPTRMTRTHASENRNLIIFRGYDETRGHGSGLSCFCMQAFILNQIGVGSPLMEVRGCGDVMLCACMNECLLTAHSWLALHAAFRDNSEHQVCAHNPCMIYVEPSGVRLMCVGTRCSERLTIPYIHAGACMQCVRACIEIRKGASQSLSDSHAEAPFRSLQPRSMSPALRGAAG